VQVVVLPPPATTAAVEEFRRLHDPSFHRLPAHVPLLPPFEAEREDLLARFDSLRGCAPFEAALGPPQACGAALVLPLTAGAAELAALRQSLAQELLGPLGAAPEGAPAMRVGLFGSDAERELARRALASLPAPAAFTVEEATLLLEDVRGLWHPIRARRLVR
jgi:hypothetical protein